MDRTQDNGSSPGSVATENGDSADPFAIAPARAKPGADDITSISRANPPTTMEPSVVLDPLAVVPGLDRPSSLLTPFSTPQPFTVPKPAALAEPDSQSFTIPPQPQPSLPTPTFPPAASPLPTPSFERDFNTNQLARGIEALREADAHPKQIGPFRIISVLGEGGMGVVYEAEQQRPRRVVALKVIRPQLVTDTMLKRFDLEVSALARLQHPGIATVFEAGATDTDFGLQPYVVMELVRGRPLNVYAEQAKLETRERLELLARICDAVQHAHQKGIIHRDLKPSNILVDETGQPKVLDFGVAKLTGDSAGGAGGAKMPSLMTEVGNIVGTLPYMSPEQASGMVGEVDTRSDIYSLGVICYELLAGRRPYDLSGRVLPDAVRVIREEEPTPLSSISRQYRGDIETIIAKALAKEKDRRYSSAGGLAADIRRHLDDEPIAARKASTAYQLVKFARRHKALVASTFAVALVLVLGVIATSWQALEARRRANEAAASKVEADGQRTIAVQKAQVASAKEAEALRLLGERYLHDAWTSIETDDPWTGLLLVHRAMRLGPQDSRWQSDRRIAIASILATTPRLLGQSILADGPPPDPTDKDFYIYSSRVSPDQRRAVTLGADTVVRLWDLRSGQLARRLDHAGKLNDAQFSQDGNQLLTCSNDGFARLWQLEPKAATDGNIGGASGPTTTPTSGPPPIMLQHASPVFRGIFNRPGTRVVTAASGDGPARLWDTANGQSVAALSPSVDAASEASALVTCVAFSPKGDLVAIGDDAGNLRVWTSDAGEPRTGFLSRKGQVVTDLAFDPSGSRIVAGYRDGTVRMWDVAAGQQASEGWHRTRVSFIVFSSDGRRFATGSDDRTVLLWDSAGSRVGNPLRHESSITGMAFSPDGRRIVTTAGEEPAYVWDAETGLGISYPLPHGTGARGAWFGNDSNRLITMGWDRTVRTWDLRSGGQPRAAAPTLSNIIEGDVPAANATPATGGVRLFAFSANGRRAATADNAGNFIVWDTLEGRTIADPFQHAGGATSFHMNADGSKLITAGWDRAGAGRAAVVQVRDVRRGAGSAGVRTLDHNRLVVQARLDPAGRLAATVTDDDTARIWNVEAGQRVATLGSEGTVKRIAFAERGGTIAAIATDGTVRVHDAETGRQVAVLQDAANVTEVGFSANGEQIATAGRDGIVRVWDARSGQPLSPPLRHPYEMNIVSFSADGRRLLTVCASGPARVWDTATWRPLTKPIKYASQGRAEINADGSKVVMQGSDGFARVWDVATDEMLAAPLRPDRSVRGACFAPDGVSVVTIATDGAVRLWDLRPDAKPLLDIESLAELLAAKRFDATEAELRLTATELQARWTDLSRRYPQMFENPAP